jgi:hypothetical protein
MLGSGASFETVGAEYGRDGTPLTRIIDGGIGLSEMNAEIRKMSEGETSGILIDTDGSVRIVRERPSTHHSHGRCRFSNGEERH